MRKTGKHFDKTSISFRLRALILQLAVPLSLLSLFVVLVFLLSSLSLAQVSRNKTVPDSPPKRRAAC